MASDQGCRAGGWKEGIFFYRLQTCGTFTARNDLGEQHESGEQVYDTVRNVLESASFFCPFPDRARAGLLAPERNQEEKKAKTIEVRHIYCTQRHTRAE